jgi:hypothetical protein
VRLRFLAIDFISSSKYAKIKTFINKLKKVFMRVALTLASFTFD